MLTQRQKDFCAKRKIRKGWTYMLPRFGFTAYPVPSYSCGEYINTNPFTKSLDFSPVTVLGEKDGFYKVKFDGRREMPFYVSKSEMEFRGVFITLILRGLLWPFFSLYNIITGNKDEVQEQAE